MMLEQGFPSFNGEECYLFDAIVLFLNLRSVFQTQQLHSRQCHWHCVTLLPGNALYHTTVVSICSTNVIFSISATSRLAQHPCCFFTPTASNHLLFWVKCPCFGHFAMQHSGDDAQQCFAKFGKSNLASSEVLCKSSAIKHGQMWRLKFSRNSKTKAVKKQ